MQELAIIIGLGLLGVLGHSLLKYRSLSTDAQKANVTLSFMRYLTNDWTGIALSVIGVVVWPLLQQEIISKYQPLEGLVRTFAFVLGLSGSYVLQLIFSRSKAWLRTIVDRKTNIADQVS